MINTKLRVFKIEMILPQATHKQSTHYSRDCLIEDFKESMTQLLGEGIETLPEFAEKYNDKPLSETEYHVTPSASGNIHIALTAYTGAQQDGINTTYIITLVGSEMF